VNRFAKTLLTLLIASLAVEASAQVAIRGKTIHTMAGAPISDGIVVIQDGKISAIGRADQIKVPDGYKVLEAAVVTPGLIDARSTVGLSGILNTPEDSDQLERSAPIQPELRAIDAYNATDPLIEWIRSFGVTTVHTGHAPGELISGQTLIAKTRGGTVEEAVIVPAKAIAATLGAAAQKEGGKSPGTRGKSVAMLRGELIKAREYLDKQRRAEEAAAKAAAADKDKAAESKADEKGKADAAKPAAPSDPPPRDLRLEALTSVLKGELPLMIAADRSLDIASALRLAKEFNIRLWLDGASESYLLIDDIKAAGVPVISHPPMQRSIGERENLSMETAAKLVHAGIPVGLQSGFEAYVPKTRVVLFEAGIAAGNGLTFDEALRTITIDAAKILGIDGRVGSLEVGKDGDVALYDGDPFEYTTHCTGCVIEGVVVSEVKR
jgi:imidazolonepropionase-like amidohydrolase